LYDLVLFLKIAVEQDETATTGTGFPNVFYLTYGMYRDYFPLLALASVPA